MWNARNQLTAISGPGLTGSFTYDSFGRRTGKTINATTTNFVYDGLNTVQEKAGATVTANLLTGLGIDEFLTRTDGVGVRALLPDALGSTVALGDGTGTLQTQYTYEPFGFVSQTGAASTSSYKYTGWEDDETGLLYYRARYYQPRLQRFIAEDPIGFVGGDANLYGYVRNNPVIFIDSTGLFCTYSQSSGGLICTSGLSCSGYSGSGQGLNNPAAQGQLNIGPLPRGSWIVGQPNTRRGPMTLPLSPVPGTDMDGRSGGFLIHGDNRRGNNTASTGCMILPRDCREQIPEGEMILVVP